MNVAFAQDKRLGRLSTVLGKDKLVLMRFRGTDFINDVFTYTVDALSTEPNIDFDALIGTHATVEIESQTHGPRPFDGIVTEAKWAGVGENGNTYELTLRPWLWLASHRRNQRIFHKKTVVQIIEELFQDYSGLGKPALTVDLTSSYPELEYTVQYRESDMDFACRMLERFGITYRFDHDVGSHTMVLTDGIDSHPKIVGGSRVYKAYDGDHNSEHEHFWEWHPYRRLTTGAIRHTDYNFKKPNAAMEVDHKGNAKHQQGRIESYDYPGDYLEQKDGEKVAKLRTLQERGQDARHRAIGDCTSLGSGMLVDLEGDQVPGVKGTRYLCLSATHSYVSDSYGTGADKGDGYAYSGAYVFMPDTAPLAPERKTPVPLVHGPQTAVVVGEGEIDCDEYGRILVHFHWDLENAYSMRCRVSQNWASQGWGGMVIPRIGMEVIVEFLEGDPDKPIITGCVYNGKNMPPYDLPKHKTRSTFKTDTHQGSGFNELRFEDEKNKEEIFLHAQKDRNTKVENNQTEHVNVNKVESVGHNKASEIGNNSFQIVDGDMHLRVGPANKGSFTPTGATKDTEGIKNVSGLLGTKKTAKKGIGDLKISVEESKTQVIGRHHFETVEGDKDTHVNKSYKAKVANKVEINAGDEILLICGKSRIKLSQNGTIEINGQKILELGDQLISLQSDTIKLN
ncbi:type VI secretion system secreted protein VgrG [Cognatiyoonia koreensis]|uniref:Type VI secretion system secreted protein VgrG n=1 Tax=Cognatiyoonia koreensis TaxID=364200 RepID=A0A1I0RS11_9RHOB|nr:type VI secretion system tip protein TssI/VgrG [Cognatiyoonia koreensis]SEW44126.1 type VI secretion system secreted protein VgrG [Cognatiyoonia koreensis]